MRLHYPPAFATIAALTMASACGASDASEYRSATTCLANELAWHRFVDQQTNPASMLPEDGRRAEILRSRTLAAGRKLGLRSDRIERDVREEASAMIKQDGRDGVQTSALRRVEKARSCLPKPGGTTRLS